ncbi:MAG: glycolate oxidase subunit GlcE [Pseudohongiellaceae bacterium]
MTQNSLHILQEQIQQAHAEKTPLVIKGNSSKSFYGYPVNGTRLNTAIHSGIIAHEPEELILTARAGTTLEEIEQTLAAHRQILACEAPRFGNATFGGMIAAGLSGPGRVFYGSIADHILGCSIINGRGELLRFGGKVMKNVAGYDISRLMCGSMGCLGLIVEATVRIAPAPQAERTFRFTLQQNQVAAFINNLQASAYPVTASCHDQELLYVRFSGTTKQIGQLHRNLHQDFAFIEHAEDSDSSFWQHMRDQELDFFQSRQNIWRLSLPPAAPATQLPGATLIEWNGALRWLKSDAPAEDVFRQAAALNGSACLFRTQHRRRQTSLFQPLPAALMQWHRELKRALDPELIFNRGRMYQDL